MLGSDDASNVLFVVLDTVRKDHLSVYGYDRPTTPTLDDFAAEARVFEHAVAPAPWTLPVHASMFTGRYPSEHGATQETPYLEGERTLAESLTAAGYDTACYSSNAWITPYTNLTAGFDSHDSFFELVPADLLSGPLADVWKALNDNERLSGLASRLVQVGNKFHEYFAAGESADTKTPAVIDETIEFVDRSDHFFAFVNLMDAHMPYHPPQAAAETFAPGVDSTAVCQNAKDFNAGARDVDDAEWADIRALYDAEIAHMDAELGRLFSHLKATDRWADTTVIVVADHGELHGEHDLFGHEFAIYEPLINVPLLVKHPDLQAGRDTETTVELLDLYHTVLDATGVDGLGVAMDPVRSLLDEDYREFDESIGDLDRSDVAFVEYHQPAIELAQLESRASLAGIDISTASRFYSRMGAARSPDAKFIHNTRIPDEGYHLATDPDETNDVGTDVPEIARLSAALSAFVEDVDADWPADDGGSGGEQVDDGTGEPPLGDVDEPTKRRLQELGYLE